MGWGARHVRGPPCRGCGVTGYRGRLIRPNLVEIAPLDIAATAAVDPPGLPDSGYDPILREPYTIQDGDDVTTTRTEGTTYQLEAQIEVPRFGLLDQLAGGNAEIRSIRCVFHLEDLEDRGFVDAEGKLLVKFSDRLVAVYSRDGVLQERFDDVPMYAVEVTPLSYGLAGGRRNLVAVLFKQRAKAK